MSDKATVEDVRKRWQAALEFAWVFTPFTPGTRIHEPTISRPCKHRSPFHFQGYSPGDVHRNLANGWRSRTWRGDRWPARGTLLIVGGGEKSQLWDRFIELAGGADAEIVVIPTAQEQVSETNKDVAALKQRGVRKLHVMHTRQPEVANDDTFVAPLKTAQAVWITGGRQWRLVDAYLNTKMHRALNEVLERGGTIGGSSAGASIQASYLVRGAREGNTILMAPGYEVGFGFLKQVAIDQHVNTRKREADMPVILAAHPELLGIGLDEATAIIVRGNECEVIGESVVRFSYRRDTELVCDELKAGNKYDLQQRRAIPATK